MAFSKFLDAKRGDMKALVASIVPTYVPKK